MSRTRTKLDVEAGDDACECDDGPLPGMFATDDGIERCDLCSRYDGDLEAALAAAALVGGVVRFYAVPADENLTDDECEAAVELRTYTTGADIEGVWIQSGTDPWVEVDGVAVRWDLWPHILDKPMDVRQAAVKLAAGWDGGKRELLEAVALLGIV